MLFLVAMRELLSEIGGVGRLGQGMKSLPLLKKEYDAKILKSRTTKRHSSLGGEEKGEKLKGTRPGWKGGKDGGRSRGHEAIGG
jgi:hypothetical protein